MGLDIYVGSLTRYYSGDWTLPTGAWAEQMDIPFGILGSHATTSDPKPDHNEVRESVLAWRKALGRKLAESLDWDESDQAPFFTEPFDRNWLDSLRLWAAHEEHSNAPEPLQFPQKDDWRTLLDQMDSTSRYPNLLRSVYLWLPCVYDRTVRGEDVHGEAVTLGSSLRLLEELKTLNSRTWKADLSDLMEFKCELSDDSEPEWRARMGFIQLLKQADRAVRHRLPMLLD